MCKLIFYDILLRRIEFLCNTTTMKIHLKGDFIMSDYLYPRMSSDLNSRKVFHKRGN